MDYAALCSHERGTHTISVPLLPSSKNRKIKTNIKYEKLNFYVSLNKCSNHYLRVDAFVDQVLVCSVFLGLQHRVF